jgi:hypothetical protein
MEIILTEKEQKNLFSKLRTPIHIGYISNYILKRPLEETKLIINNYINQGLIEESSHVNEYYYGLKKN